MNISIESLQSLDSSFFEEDSYEFLIFYQSYKEWKVYDSNEISNQVVLSLANNFMNFHGKIPFPEDILNDLYWSAVPINAFRYKLLQNLECGLVDPTDSQPGYIVEGVYWTNGFVYVVRDKNNIIQIKLFIDSETYTNYGYP
jgi:hypothetical protein